MVNPWNTRLLVAPPLFTIEPPVNVTMPAEGAKVCELSTVKGPAMENPIAGWVSGVPAISNPWNVKVPELAILQPVPEVTRVPDDGVNVPVLLNAPVNVAEPAPVIDPLIFKFP
jgi:hypothetical protein